MTNISKQDAAFYGALAGGLPAMWLGAYLFHLAPLHIAQMHWWGFPWYVTVIAVVVITDWLFAIGAVALLNKNNGE